LRALCVLHDAFSSTGLIGDTLRARGWQVDETLIVPAERYHSPDVDFSFPDHRDYDLLVPMGAPWSAYDEAGVGRWLVPELSWLSRAVASGGAVFGICFGAQALARALGGSVALSGYPEIGWTAVESEVPELISPGPWFQWHFDTFTPPPGATVLARTVPTKDAATVQAFRVGRSLGVQFHPEVTGLDIKMWLENGGDAQARAQGIDPADLLAEAARQEEPARARAGQLIDAYVTKIFAA
jgi:GMP synthase-like glutamine amidotransferase